LRTRRQVAIALRDFDHPESELHQLRNDPDHRVIAAVLEECL
jgi:hypothetical protein